MAFSFSPCTMWLRSSLFLLPASHTCTLKPVLHILTPSSALAHCVPWTLPQWPPDSFLPACPCWLLLFSQTPVCPDLLYVVKQKGLRLLMDELGNTVGPPPITPMLGGWKTDSQFPLLPAEDNQHLSHGNIEWPNGTTRGELRCNKNIP